MIRYSAGATAIIKVVYLLKFDSLSICEFWTMSLSFEDALSRNSLTIQLKILIHVT